MSLNKEIEDKLKELEEISVTGGGEAYDTPNAFKKKKKEDDDMNESKFRKIAKATFLSEGSYKEYNLKAKSK